MTSHKFNRILYSVVDHSNNMVRTKDAYQVHGYYVSRYDVEKAARAKAQNNPGIEYFVALEEKTIISCFKADEPAVIKHDYVKGPTS